MMTAILSFLIPISAAAVAAEAPANPVLTELVQKGVVMPDGSAIPLPAPTMTDGMSVAEQTKAIEQVAATARSDFQRFTQKTSAAPVKVAIRTLKGKEGATFRAVDLWFVVHGDWDTLLSEKFGDALTKANPGQAKNEGGTLSKSGFLNDAEMQKRGLTSKTKAGQEERYFYTTFTLFDRAEVSATRYAVLTRAPDSVLLAAKVDPRFAKDAEYPNLWQTLERDATAKIVKGPKQPYQGAGFYIKLTKLRQPAGTIFVEYHSVFHEPQGWFDGENLLRAKLPTIAEHQVKQFRGKLAKASADLAEQP